jgi:hypothetical protein
MSRKSSTFINETRERENWLGPALEREHPDGKEARHMLATAALVRGAVNAISVPEEAEERSRATAVAHMQRLREERLLQRNGVQAPWYLRFGRLLRTVFTLGRRR